ncbi:hypothetical protein EDD21DRAFT_131875 [Dissophora ornata]|nr:hypothetical protein EDD21DRAFT_131875 [Dissophora ornata]
MDNQNERKNSLTMRLSKTPIPDSSSFASMEQQSRDSTQSRSSNLTSVMKKTSKSGQQLASPAHSVEFDLQGDVTTTQPTKKSKGKAAASRDIDQEENDTSRTRRVEIEQVETTVGTTTRSTASSVSESSSGRLLSQTTTTARKRYNLDSPDLPSSTSSEISSGSRQSSTSNVSVVIVKKRRLARVESAVEVDAITDNASDGSGETDIPNFEDVRISTNSTSALSQPKALQRRKVVKVELFGEDESQQQQQLQLQGAGEPSQPTKKRGRPKKKIEEDNESESLPTARSKRKTAVRATKQGGRSTSLLKSTATKKAPKALIEIFDLPDEEMENNDKPEPEPKESGNEPEHMQVDAPSVAEDRVQSLDHPAPTNATTDAQESANEEIYPTAASNDQPRTQEVTATVNTDSSPHDSSRVDVTTPAEPPVTTEEHAIAPIEHLSTPVKRRGRSYSPILYSTTPVRQQAVSLLDIEYADVVVIDPKTPNRRMASRMDIEGWEDEDRRESLQTRLSSPFISPSQWEFDGSLSTSTPKPKRTPVRLVPGITPRQRVKDMVGNSSAFSNPGSPSFKKTRLNLLSPENNHEELVDRLGGLMKEYDSSQVMAAAELALKEEVKLLRRSQNKERKLAAAAAAAASAAPSETPFGPPSEAQEDDDLLMLEPESSNSNSNKSNILGTPVKNAGVSLMFESTTPGTPLSRTPLPISKVISAIGAASRRNPNAHVSPFVRTPAKKTVDLLRLEDLETDEDTSLRQKERDRTRVNRDAQDVNPFVDSHHSQIMEPVRMAGSRREPAFDPPASQKRRSSSDHLGPKDLTKPSAKPSHSLRDPEEPVESRSGAQLSLEEQDRRRRLMGECGISGREITMSVEEFHRHCADEQIRLFELQCEAWIQRFLEEAERVRNAIMDDGRR